MKVRMRINYAESLSFFMQSRIYIPSCIFRGVDPFVKTFLVKSYSLSLYGCSLWSLSSSTVKTIQIPLNQMLWKVWNLPRESHTAIVQCVAETPSISNLIYGHFMSLYSSATSSTSPLVQSLFAAFSKLIYAYSFTSHNFLYGHKFVRFYNAGALQISFFFFSLVLLFLLSGSFTTPTHGVYARSISISINRYFICD